MSAAEAPVSFGLTGGRRGIAIAAAAVLLTTFFVVLGFPYHRVAPRVAAALEAATGGRVTIGRLGVGIGWLAPQMQLFDVSIAWPDGRRVGIDRLRVHPAWSLSWLRGAPALVVALRSPLGELDGSFTLGDAPGFRGELRGVALAQLPIGEWAGGLGIEGAGAAELDVALADEGPVGTARFEIRDGSVSYPGMPIGLPFETLAGDLAVGGDALVEVRALELQGPLAGISGTGRIGRAAAGELAPLALEAHVEARDPTVRSMLQGRGLALDAAGATDVVVRGTLAEPELQVAAGGRGGR